MALAGWTWNLMNLMALPLMLGTGVDYTLFIQLALRRHGGDLGVVRRSVGRALMLCGGTAVAGFGSLGFSSNPGMASLGKVCAVGIGANMLISVFLLPAWWRCLVQSPKLQGPKAGRIPSPKPRLSSRALRLTNHMIPAHRFHSRNTHHASRARLRSIAPDCGGSDWSSCEFCRPGW